MALVTITIITVGSKPPSQIAELIASYEQRLPKTVRISWHIIKHEALDPETSITKESESILRMIPKQAKVLLLDEEGEGCSSPQFSGLLFSDSKDAAIIIGGAYGVSRTVFEKADKIIALGSMIYPHQIVRLIVAEQIYRAYTISTGHPYHHG